MNYHKLKMIRNIRLELAGIKINKFEPLEKGPDDPCWEDYVQVGTKVVDGREVPNCVPMDAQKVVKEGFPIPSPEGSEDEEMYIGRCMKEIGGEYEQEQALGICYSKWRDKK